MILRHATLVLITLWAAQAVAQPVASPAPAKVSPTAPPALVSATTAAPANDEDYRVGPGDVLEVTVFGNEDLSRITTVQSAGTISLPLLGDVTVAELSVAEIKHKLITLLARDYLVSPQVEVKVKDYQSQSVTVLGEVNAPGRKSLRGRTRLIDVLVDAGGFTPRASGEVSISRGEGQFESGEHVMRVRLSGTSPAGQDQINLELPLHNGDIVTASPKYYVTVDGEVQRPGRYVLDGDLTVTGAISTAGGLTRFGAGGVKLRRVNPSTGAVTIVEVDLKAVRKGKKADVPLQPNDVISVPKRLF